MRRIHREKPELIDVKNYVLFEEAAEFLSMSRRSFATMLAEFQTYWRTFDTLAKERHRDWIKLGTMALEDVTRGVTKKYGRGAVDFPRPIRFVRRYYFERAKLTRFRDLQKGLMPLP